MIESNIFFAGLLIFIAAFLFFYLYKRENTAANINMLVALITTTSYTVLFAMLGAIKVEAGEYVYPTRWLFYIVSCGFLMYEVALIMKKSQFDTFKMIALNTIVMFAGYLASISDSLFRWVFFMISTLAFIVLIFLIHEPGKREKKIVYTIRWYVTFTWIIFPIVWIFAPTGLGIINAFYTALLYLALDITTKIIFGVITARQKI